MTDGPMVGWGERGITVRALPGRFSRWTFRLVPRPVEPGRMVVAAVEIIAPADEAVTMDAWRHVPIGTLLRLASDPSAHVVAVAAGLAPDPSSLRSGSREHADAVVTVYRYAVSQGVPPRPVLAETFGVADKTVDRWLKRARDRGLLGTWAQERTGDIKAPQKGKTR